MNTLTRLTALLTTFAVLGLPATFAQRQLGKKKGPTSKLYLAETVGEGQITTEGKTHEARKATAFDAPGTVIQTKKDSHQAFVYSNGSGMFVDQDTRVEVDRFVQEPFRPDRNNTDMEPSISQSDVFVARGQVGICTGQLVSGTTMNYATPHGSLNIRGGKIAIKSGEKETTIYLLEGDATVKRGGRDLGGALLRPGEQAVIRPGPPGRPASITVSPIDQKDLPALDEKVAVACNARKTVTFETIEKKAEVGFSEPPPGQTTTEKSSDTTTDTGTPTTNTGSNDTDAEIVPVPTTPTAPPPVIPISADRITPKG